MNKLKEALRLYPLLAFYCFIFLPFGSSGSELPLVHNLYNVPTPANDTVKYQGYRLDFTNFKIIKKTGFWVKLQFTVINSGRKDIYFSKKGTEHWVQFNYDPSLFDLKLGGLRENIKYVLSENNFSLAAGQSIRNMELKVPTFLPGQRQPDREPDISFSERKTQQDNGESEAPVFTSKGGNEDTLPMPELPDNNLEKCADILFTHLQIIEQDDKWATVEYTIVNQGKGNFHLFGTGEAGEKLAIRAYISGAPVMSRGALPIGGEFIRAASGHAPDLRPSENFTGRIRLDIRKKTRYLKSLILSLESDQFASECDKTNNTKAVILE